jgi:hypothetical protein
MKTHKTQITATALIVTIIVCLMGYRSVHAYSHLHCNGNNLRWPSHQVSWRASANGFPEGSRWRTALTTANSRWNQAPGDFTFYIRNWDEEHSNRGNDQDEIWFSRNQDVLNGAPAVCYYWYTCILGVHEFTEADIAFDADLDWSASDNVWTKWEYGGDYRPWGTTALHEMGHALGLMHVNSTYNIMGQDWTHIHANDESVRHYAGEDAGTGDIHLYGQTDNINKDDLGVSHWKYGSADGEYSEHVPCRIYNPDDTHVSREDEVVEGFKRYLVQAGQSYKVQFTFENNGYNDQEEVDVAHYVSTNRRITTIDTRVRAGTMTLDRNTVYTAMHTITLPNDLVVGGVYYIGVIVDYTGSITEFTGSNNATYLPIRIVP